MHNDHNDNQQEILPDTGSAFKASETVIPVVQEMISVNKKTIDTAKIHISKKVTAHQEEIKVPLIAEQYEIIHVPINQTVATPPPAVRREGDTTIYSVIKEVLVVEKRYEIVEEVHISRRVTEHMETQSITLRTEEVSIVREPLPDSAKHL